MKRSLSYLVCVCAVATLSAAALSAQAPGAGRGAAPKAVHAKQVKRLLITNAMVIYGNAKPPFGPVDIMTEDGLIARIGNSKTGDWPAADVVIDATDKYVMPGMINTHMHWHEDRVPGIPMPIQYERNLYLASGVTTVREVGNSSADGIRKEAQSTLEKAKRWQAESNAHTIIAPRMVEYPFVVVNGASPEALRQQVRDLKKQGADGLKLIGFDRDQLAAVIDEARKLGLPTTTHTAVEETTARDYVDLGVNCIEHFYGVADAALDGIQDFRPEHNSFNEIHRFGRAGELYIQNNFDPSKLSALLDDMVKKGVAWSPTLSTYEAARDLIKAQNLPWYKDYLHPSLEAYYEPSMARHGTFWTGWSEANETAWRRNYRVWMDALYEFGRKGGIITTGDDAGYLYGSLYGFGIIRELELQQEAGFHPLEVLKHATVNGAKVLGFEEKLGRVRLGYIADLLVVNGNPLENLRILNPAGTDLMSYNGKIVNNYSGFVKPGDPNVKLVHGGGIEWTIKDGIPYHVPTLMKEVKDMVASARAARGRATTSQP